MTRRAVLVLSALFTMTLAFGACSGVLHQDNSNGFTGNFDGKVIKSNLSGVKVGTRCQGRTSRKKNAQTAKVTVNCKWTKVYEGSGEVHLEVRNRQRRDDDRIEIHDSASSDIDGTPMMTYVADSDNADLVGGRLFIWDKATKGTSAFELIIVL